MQMQLWYFYMFFSALVMEGYEISQKMVKIKNYENGTNFVPK
jgi:hypothetical protein